MLGARCNADAPFYLKINDVDERRNIIAKCEAKLKELEMYNEKLLKAVTTTEELREWSKATAARLRELKSLDANAMKREERVKEAICLQEEAKKRMKAIKDLEYEYNKLLSG